MAVIPPRTGVISQVRMTSTRLPGKVLKPINGKPMLAYHVERLAATLAPVILATTANASDDPVVSFAQDHCLGFFRGDEHHVLERFYQTAVAHQLEVIVRVTSDCPLIDGSVLYKALEFYAAQHNPNLYVSNVLERTYPRGLDFEIFSFSLLQEAYEKATLPGDLEHVTPYIHQNRSGRVQFHHIKRQENKSAYRITLDTEDDFRLLEELITRYGADQLDAEEIITLLDRHPELVALNAHVEQKKV